MMRRRIKKWTVPSIQRGLPTLFLVALAGVLLLTGCGGSEPIEASSEATLPTLVAEDVAAPIMGSNPQTGSAESGADGQDLSTDDALAVTVVSPEGEAKDLTITGAANADVVTAESLTGNPQGRQGSVPDSATSSSAKGTLLAPTTAKPSTTTKPSPAPETRPGAFLWVDFESSQLGAYGDKQIRDDWSGIRYTQIGDFAKITDEANNRFLRVKYPKGKVGHSEGGGLWALNLGSNSGDDIYSSYRVRFNGGFDPVLGGKLPGLSGGEHNSGGDKPTGRDGWSARIIWRPGQAANQYLYHPDQPSKWGEDLPWGKAFPQDQWVTLETRIKMNTPGRKDGVVQTWMNGQPALNRTDIRFRDVDSFAVDGFLFSTFFGGSGAEWAPNKDEYIDFDDFKISASPITH